MSRMNLEYAFNKTVAKAKNISRTRPKSVKSEVYDELQDLMPDEHLPYLMAQGGEHFVFGFDDPKHPDLIYKINVPETLPVVKAQLSGNPERLEKAKEEMKRMINKKREQLAEMRQYFGAEAVPAQQYMVREVPVSKKLVEVLLKDPEGQVEEIESVPALVVVQRRVDMPSDWTISLNGFYPESPKSALAFTKDRVGETIEAGNEILLGGMMSELDRESQLRWVVKMYPELDTVAWRAERDPEFKAKLEDLAYRLVEFTQDTNIPLELAGRDNMVMTKGPKGWTVKLMDVLPMDRYSMNDFKRILAKLSVGGKLNGNEAGVALNILNTIRMVNAIALIADIPERFKVIGLERVTTETWCKEFEQLFKD